MKKFRTLVLGLVVFVLITGTCLASSFDLSSISLGDASIEDLITLRGLIEDELAARGFYENEILQPGFYVAGKDIVPGSFTLSILPGSTWYTYITVYADLTAKEERKKLYALSLAYGDSGMILDNGNVLVVEYTPCVCKLNETKKSWAP